MGVMYNLPIKTKFDERFFAPETKELVVSTKTKRLWAVELDLLLEFDRICKKNSLKYSLEGGTLLGSVRHGGFIPWDDDIDVVMIRSEYEKLCRIGPEEFKHPYFFQNDKTDIGCYRPHVQIRNSETTCILKGEMADGRPLYKFNQGVFIDVFVADEVPDNMEERAKFLASLVSYKERFALSRFVHETKIAWRKNITSLSALSRTTWVYLSYLRRTHTLKVDVDESFDNYMALASSNNKGFAQCGPISLNPRRRLESFYDVADFNDLIEVEFEGYKLPAFRMYDKVLTRLYGDWNEHVIGGGLHGGLFIDLDKPYTEYLKK